MKMKKTISILLSLLLISGMFTACGGNNNSSGSAGSQPAPATEAAQQTAQPATEENSAVPEDIYIAVISKGFQHQFWQTVYAGSQDAAAALGISITFEGPASESDISDQVDMLNGALAKNPNAIALAALDTDSVTAQLNSALSAGVPVIGFDSGVPNAPAGSIVSTASTDNYAAGELAAEEMFKEASFNERLSAATADNRAVIAVQSQDATSASILDRTNGFIDKMTELASAVHPGGIEVVGHDVFNKAAEGDVIITIKVTVPPSTSYTDAQNAAQSMLQNTDNLIGYFVSNEASVTGLLAATNDGTDLDREKGTYKDLIAIGFDAGSTQKIAVANKYFYGSVTQDPYMIGYYAVELAYKAIMGEQIDEIVDTGCKFYTSENMEQPDIAQLLYD